MNVKFLPSIKFSACKNVFSTKLQDIESLPQRQELKSFIADNKINDHNIVQLIVNNGYCSLDDLSNIIINTSKTAHQYLYLAINKFTVYSTVDLPCNHTDSESYDFKLVEYCYELIKDKFTLLKYTVRPDDNGTMGNFVYPVTTVFFKRHD